MMRLRVVRIVTLSATVIVALFASAGGLRSARAAQEAIASMSGAVEDPLGGLLAGVLVTLTNASGAMRSVMTFPDGTFRFEGLPEGRYDLEMVRTGFSETRNEIVLGPGHTIARTVRLSVGTVEEVLRITMIDPGRASTDRTARAPAPRPRPSAACAKAIACVQPPTKLVDVKPQYPSNARIAGIYGMVVVEAVINAQGIVDEIKPVVTPDRDLVEAAITAIRQWQFTPALLNGVPVDAPMNVSVEFVGGLER